jgi:transposase
MIGLDLGGKKTCFCEVRDGKVVGRASVRSFEQLIDMLGPNTPPARVLIEACREAWHVHDKLVGWGHEVWMLDTTRARQIGIGAHGKKTDRIDAEVLAHALEQNRVPRAHVLSPDRRRLREQVNVRRALVKARAELATSIRGILGEEGLKVPSCPPDYLLDKLQQVEMPDWLRSVLEPLKLTLAATNEQLARAETRLRELCNKEPVITVLATIKGVSMVVAAQFVAVIDDAGRFKHAHQVEAYLGLVPLEDTTGGKRKLGSITKQGNTYLRSLLVQAAWTIVRTANPDDPLRRWAEAVAARRSKRVAVIALARRLAGILWAMWRDGTVYDAGALGNAQARGLRQQAQSMQFKGAAMKAAARKLAQRRAPHLTEVIAIG